MRRLLLFALSIILLLGMVPEGHLKPASAADVRSTSVILRVGESIQFYYFNVTLIDISVFGDSAMIKVHGIQGNVSTTLQINVTEDIFRDQSLQIILQEISANLYEESTAKMMIIVDLEALANTARDMLKDKINDPEVKDIFPDVVIQQYQQKLDVVNNYILVGDYISAVELAKSSLDKIDHDLPLAKDALASINKAKAAIMDPSTVTEGCQVPSSILSQAQEKLNTAQEAFNNGDFEDAKAYADDAYTLIYNSCNSCGVYPSEKERVTEYLERIESREPGIPLDPAWKKMTLSIEEYENGNCLVAISYLNDVVSLAESIWEDWNKTKECKNELKGMINSYASSYSFTYNGETISLKVGDILLSIPDQIDKYMREGKFQTAMSNCKLLKGKMEARKNQFVEAWRELNRTRELIENMSTSGYILKGISEEMETAIEKFKDGNYSEARDVFLNIQGTIAMIKENADLAKSWENKTRSCLAQRVLEGMNVSAVFGRDLKRAQVLYEAGNYSEAYHLWEALYKQCTDPEITATLNERNDVLEMYNKLKGIGVTIPPEIQKMIEEAERQFRSNNLTICREDYKRAKDMLSQLLSIVEDAKTQVANAKRFMEMNRKQAEQLVKLVGIPEVQRSFKRMEALTESISNNYKSGNVDDLQVELSELQSIQNDIDQDGYPNTSDPLPYIPNYYVFGLAVVLTLLIVQILR